MKTILIATHNPAKFNELKKGLKILINRGISLISLKELNINSNPEEIGNTFEDNAILKAKYYASLSRLPTLADDGGLIIPILNNEPGVKSRRWLGRESTDQELIDYTLQRLKGYPKDKRTAYLQVCLCLYDPQNNIMLIETEKIKGYIATKESKKPTNGYPYRALFMVDKFNKYYDEMAEEEHNLINHRLKAIKRLVKKI